MWIKTAPPGPLSVPTLATTAGERSAAPEPPPGAGAPAGGAVGGTTPPGAPALPGNESDPRLAAAAALPRPDPVDAVTRPPRTLTGRGS